MSSEKNFDPAHQFRAEMWGAVAGSRVLVLLTSPGGPARRMAKGTDLFFVKQTVESVYGVGRVLVIDADQPGTCYLGLRPQ